MDFLLELLTVIRDIFVIEMGSGAIPNYFLEEDLPIFRVTYSFLMKISIIWEAE